MRRATGGSRVAARGPLGTLRVRPDPNRRRVLERYRDFFVALIVEPECAGFSYVQLYDVEGEVNGYLTYDRKPKVPPDVIAPSTPKVFAADRLWTDLRRP